MPWASSVVALILWMLYYLHFLFSILTYGLSSIPRMSLSKQKQSFHLKHIIKVKKSSSYRHSGILRLNVYHEQSIILTHEWKNSVNGRAKLIVSLPDCCFTWKDLHVWSKTWTLLTMVFFFQFHQLFLIYNDCAFSFIYNVAVFIKRNQHGYGIILWLSSSPYQLVHPTQPVVLHSFPQCTMKCTIACLTFWMITC